MTSNPERVASGRAITNIRILNNQIIDPPRFGVFIGSATKVTLTDTTVTATADSAVFDKSAALCVENAAGVVVSKLSCTDPRKCVEAGVVIRKSTDAAAAGITLADDTFKLAAGVPELLDQRP